ncbi:MAG: sugar-transfer associated ATP-grasp domain-containing protein [Candidatus Limivicinus sp.]
MHKDWKKLNEQYSADRKNFYEKVDNSRRLDEMFSKIPEDMQADEPLTEDEIRQINDFYEKYRFAYPNIDYKSFQTFKNRCGKFSVNHCPGAIRTEYFNKHFVDVYYSNPFQNKVMLDFLYPTINRPRTIVRRMNGIYYDIDYRPISLETALKICGDYLENKGDLILKINNTGGSAGVTVLKQGKGTASTLQELITKKWIVNAFVVQEMMEQSDFMKAFNPTSVNTIRITTFLWKGKVIPLAALIRIGKKGNEVDNFSAGGSLLGVDMDTGKCFNWAMQKDNRKITKLPSGLDLESTDYYVPNFNLVKESVTTLHYRIPYIRLISWDIALDKNDVPTLIECNFGGMIQIHEAITGPLFGDLMKELLDEYLVKRFFFKFATEDFVCKEFCDHIAIVEYIGESENVVVPEKIYDKPVTVIEPTAFHGCKIANYSVPTRLMRQCANAL